MTLSEELQWRGYANQTTIKDVTDLDREKKVFYFGVDPSAQSMTIGNLASAMMIRTFMKHGHKAILLVGGATGLIGDPDGKAQERDLLTPEQVQLYKHSIAQQYAQVFGGMKFTVVDNYDWFKDMNYLDFLREIGKHVPMRIMLGRDFVQARLGADGAGISYAEFSYSLIQGYDFLHLYRTQGATLQLCGADQWGNSIAGVDLIRRVEGGEADVWSMPLVINRATGKKFGKTEEGAVWLDEQLTSVYNFYQFWINVDDEGCEEYLKIYTDLEKPVIDDIMEAHNEARDNRLAQKHLAFEVTKLVHGQSRAESIRRLSDVLFGEASYDDLTAADFDELCRELKMVTAEIGADLTDILVSTELAASKGEARRFLQSNAIYINGSQIPLIKTAIEPSDALQGYIVIRRGKNQNAVVKVA